MVSSILRFTGVGFERLSLANEKAGMPCTSNAGKQNRKMHEGLSPTGTFVIVRSLVKRAKMDASDTWCSKNYKK